MLSFNLILVPVDFSDRSLRALDYAVGLAERFDSELRLVYCDEPVAPISDMAWQSVQADEVDTSRKEKAQKALEKLLSERIPSEVNGSMAVVGDKAVRGIVDYAKETNADLIVMATHGWSGLAHLVMGSTTEAVVRKAPCAVLALKQPVTVAAE